MSGSSNYYLCINHMALIANVGLNCPIVDNGIVIIAQMWSHSCLFSRFWAYIF